MLHIVFMYLRTHVVMKPLWWLRGVQYRQMRYKGKWCGLLGASLADECGLGEEYIIPVQQHSRSFLNEREISQATQPWQWKKSSVCQTCVFVRLPCLSYFNTSILNPFNRRHPQNTFSVSEHLTLSAPWRKVVHRIHSYTVSYRWLCSRDSAIATEEPWVHEGKMST